MSIFNDEDFKHYFRIFAVGFSVFAFLLILFYFLFHQRYDISLKTDEVNYGSTKNITDIIKSIGGVDITDDMILSSNTIELEEYEVTFTELDTSELGTQEIKAEFNTDGAESQTFEINIVDNKKPVIKILAEQPVEMSLDSVKNGEFDDLFSIKDNQTSVTKLDIRKYIVEDDYDYGDTVYLMVTATDISQNKAEKKIKIKINEKETKNSDSSKKDDEEDKTESIGNTSSGSSSNDNAEISNYSSVETYSVPACSYQAFYEDAYGDMISAYNAAQSYYDSCSSGSMNPINDSDGNTIGWSVG